MMSLRHGALAALLLGATTAPLANEREERLSEEHLKWLKEEVVYIITEQERDVFLSLETEEERNLLIEAFWERRDPNPATLENEFKTELYRRIEHANKFFSRDAPMPGWRTDRGRFYIMLGEPLSVQRFEGLNDVVSCEIWYYNGDPELGLPSRFNLLFFREHDVGQYELYDPVIHGPQRLVRAGPSVIPDAYQALDTLELVSPDLAIAAVTIDLTEMGSNVLRAARDRRSTFFRPSTSNNFTMTNILESPTRRVDRDYLDGYLRYGERVSVEYSFRFVPSRFHASVLPGPDDTPFVHFVLELEPENFSLQAEDAGRFETTLDIGVEVRDPEGRTIALANTVSLAVNADQLQQVARFPFAYEDDFPLAVPGTYGLSVTLRNRATKQFTVAEADIEVPSFEETIGLSDLVPAYSEERTVLVNPEEYLTFQLGGLRMNPAVEGVFAIGDTVHVFTVVRGGKPGHRVLFSILDGEAIVVETETPVSGSGSELVGGKLSLIGIAGGRYELRARLVGGSGGFVAERSSAITVSPRAEIPRAGLIYREGFRAEEPGLLPLARGQQYLVMGRVAEAIAELQKSVDAGNPQLPMAKWKLANALLFDKQADRALAILRPLEQQYADEYDVVEGLGLAYYLKNEHQAAVHYLEKAMGIRAPDITVLNALGSCYRASGRYEEARELFRRSLELKSDQPQIEEWLAEQENNGGK